MEIVETVTATFWIRTVTLGVGESGVTQSPGADAGAESGAEKNL